MGPATDRIRLQVLSRFHIMYKNSYITLFSAVLALSSCTAELAPDGHVEGASVRNMSKIVNTRSSDASNDKFFIKFDNVPGDAVLDSLCSFGAVSVEPVFNSVPGKEELEKKFGLDRWYAVTAHDQADLEALVTRFSAVSCVQALEYNVQYRKASDCVTYPYQVSYKASPASEVLTGKAFNDPSLGDQWHYINTGDASVARSVYKGADINVRDVWRTLTTGDSEIVVAVVDEGVKWSHPDLTANMWTNPRETEDGKDDDGNGYVDDIHGYNFVSNGPVSWGQKGDSGHGTHCAGTISAVNNNGVGVCGVAGGSGKGDGVKIMSCQIFDGDEGGDPQTTANAIKYAADNGASIISCSFGYGAGSYFSDEAYKNGNRGLNRLESDAIHYFEATKNNSVLDGGIAIFASGNDSKPYSAYPGAMSDVISVSAFGPDFLPAYYTNYGPGCNITAPGGEAYLAPWTSSKPMILSTLVSETSGSDYGYMQGTSMACPHVSGVVALGIAYAKKLGKTFSVSEFKNLILASTDDFETRLSSATKDYASVSAAPSISLGNYRKQMGTGAIDAWKLMMNIEGTPCLTAEIGREQWLDLSSLFGSSSINLTYGDLEYSASDAEAVGLAAKPYIKYGRLYIHPTKCGSMKIRINAIGGGTELGGASSIGGMAFSRTGSIIVKSHKSDNGGWL